MGVLEWLRRRPLRLLGTLLVFLSTGLLMFLALLDVAAGLENPYVGIVTYMILPGVLILGLILVPLDSWVQRRRAAHGQQVYPVVDLSDPTQRKLAAFFAVSSTVILVVASVVAYRSLEFMDTRTFCGLVCHRVMIPEHTAYLRSTHASVQCVPCHIGPGASWFVRSKLAGVPQVYHYARGDYHRPLQTPVEALRPSRDTCETCHSVDRFYGSALRTRITYRTDRDNTREARAMVMYVGSGGMRGSGIHGHMVSQIHYLPATRQRGEIAWVRARRPDGTTQEFVNPSYRPRLDALRRAEPTRLMDCIDCHNRAAHDFVPFEELLDDGLTRGTVDRGIPFIKQQAMAAAGSPDRVPSEAEQARALDRIGQIPAFYRKQLPAVARSQAAVIARSVRAVQTIYRGTYFPHMDVGPQTYPNWRSHAGCFRCHGVLETVGKTGAVLPAQCDLCHSQQVSGTGAELPVRP